MEYLVAVMMEISDEVRDLPYPGERSPNEFYRDIIQPAVEAASMDHTIRCVRADAILGTRLVTKDICELLLNAHVVLSELSSANPNVMYELGIRHCLGLPTITIARDAKALPFDIKAWRILEYGGLDENTLKKRITQATRRCLSGDKRYTENPFWNSIVQGQGRALPPKASRYCRLGLLNDDEQRVCYPLGSLSDWLGSKADVLVLGRTNMVWAEHIRRSWRYRLPLDLSQIHLSVFMMDPLADTSLLSTAERAQLAEDLSDATSVFERFERQYPEQVTLHFLPWVPLDSMTFYEPARGDVNVLHLDLQLSQRDDDDYHPERKNRMILEITDGVPLQDEIYDLFRRRAHELCARAGHKLDRATMERKLDAIVEPCTPHGGELEILRRNEITNYVHRTADLFDWVEGSGPMLPPMCVQIEVTGNCGPARCKICNRWRDRPSEEAELPIERIHALLRELRDMGTRSVVFTGGEPFVRTDLPEIIHYAKGQRLEVGITTDGAHLSEKAIHSLVLNASWIAVSLDAHDTKLYKQVRGWDGFDAVEDGLRRLASLRQRCSSKVRVGITYTISRHNIDYIEHMVRWYANNHDLAQGLRFKFAHGQDPWQQSEMPQAASIKELARTLARLAEDSTILSCTNVRYVLDRFLQDTSPESIEEGAPLAGSPSACRPTGILGPTCFTSYVFALVDPRGQVYPCCHLYCDNHAASQHAANRERFCMGTIRGGSQFKEVWFGDRYRTHRMDSHVGCSPLCNECTRHYQHNRVLLELFGLYSSLCLSSRQEYRELCKQHHAQHSASELLWF